MSDLISRQAAIAEAYDVVIDGNVFKVVQVETLYGLPTIDPAENGGCWGCCCEKLGQVKHGKWIIKAINTFDLSYGGTGYEPVYECSMCGGVEESYLRLDEPIMPDDADFPNYCPNCGARMDLAEDNDG